MSVKNLGSDVVVIHKGHIVDVFWGNDGWEPHARFLIRNTSKGRFLTQCAGSAVPSTVFSTVSKKVGL